MRKIFGWETYGPLAVLVVVGLALPYVAGSSFQLRIGMLICSYAVLGFAFNLLFGMTGQLSLGQPGFFALGAYALAILQTTFGISFLLAVPLSLLMCAIAALLLGLPLLRLRSHYLAMASLMFCLVIGGILYRWTDFTGGSGGMSLPPIAVGAWQLSRFAVYYLILTFAIAAYVIHAYFASTFSGRAFHAVRGDETAAKSLGIDVTMYKLRAFMAAGVLSGLGGIMSAMISRQVDPSYSDIGINVTLLTLAVVGGLRTMSGPLLGAVVVVLVPQFLASFADYEPVLYGAGLLVFMIFLPRGLAGMFHGRRLKSSSGPSDHIASSGAMAMAPGGKEK